MEQHNSHPFPLLFLGSALFHWLAFVEKSTISWVLGVIMAILGIIHLVIKIKVDSKNLRSGDQKTDPSSKK